VLCVMANWDDDEYFDAVKTAPEQAVPAAKASWEDEDFQPSWEKPPEVKPATENKPPPQPKPKPVKLEKKEPEKPLTSEERSQLKKDAEIQKQLADYDNAMELFKGVDTNKKKDHLAEEQIEILTKLEPRTQEDFAKFSAALIARVKKLEESLHYPPTIKELCKTLCNSEKLDSSDVSEIVKSLNVIVNDKLKAEKAPKKGMKKTAAKKKVTVVAKKDLDEEEDDDVTGGGPRGADDFDDFM